VTPSSVWSPYFKKDKNQIEMIQHRFTRLFPDLINKPYEDRLDVLGLCSLEERRIRADLIEVFKIIKGFSNLNHKLFFVAVSTTIIGLLYFSLYSCNILHLQRLQTKVVSNFWLI